MRPASPRTTFYNHFESKEALILAVLEHHDRWWRNDFTTKLQKYGGDDPADQLHAVFDVSQRAAEFGPVQRLHFVNVAAEFPLPHDPDPQGRG
jgi:AcrR family transcriptional regulator